MGRVLITTRSVANCKKATDMLEAAGHEIVVHIGKGDLTPEDFSSYMHGVDALIVGVDSVGPQVIDAGLPTLKIISRNGVGYNNVDIEYAAKKGVPVTIAPNASKISVCELAIGMMFAAARNIPIQNHIIKSHGWERKMGFELFGKTLGVFGCGNIGSEVVIRAAAMGMDVLMYDILKNSRVKDVGRAVYTNLDEMLQKSDVVTLHLPVTDETRGVVNKDFLKKMKRGAVLINTARGLLVNEQDVAWALDEGILSCYATDTLMEEPASEHNLLANHEKTIITPHCGAYTREAVERCGIMVAEEVIRVLNGQEALHNIAK